MSGCTDAGFEIFRQAEEIEQEDKSLLPSSSAKTVVVFAHQDDDLLWMLPFWNESSEMVLAASPLSPHTETVVNGYPQTIRSKHRAIWGSVSSDEYINTWKHFTERQKYINFATLTNYLRPLIARKDVARIITHNPWGEYGHFHHRLVYRVLHQLAAEYKKSIWVLSYKAPMTAPTQYIDQGSLGLPFVKREFKHEIFSSLRQIYLNEDNFGGAIGLLKTWTWFDGAYDYPYGVRTYVQTVRQGQDLIADNVKVNELIRSVSVYGGGFHRGQLLGAAEVAFTESGEIASCSGIKPSDGTDYQGQMNAPISCNTENTPICMDGFRRFLTGPLVDSDGRRVEQYYTCEVFEADYPNEPTDYIKGQLFGSGVVVKSSSGEVKSCSGPRNSPLSYPLFCDQNQELQCRDGFRRVPMGTAFVASDGITEEMYTCQSMSGQEPIEYLRGSLHGFAITYRDELGRLKACSTPGNDKLKSPILCGSNDLPICKAGFRRFGMGINSRVIANAEQYFTCETMN